MEGLLAGIDLCDSYTQVCGPEEENTWTFPTVICRNRGTEDWYIGEEAYGYVLGGKGILVDKLVSLLKKDGTATLGTKKYDASDLMTRFMGMEIEMPSRAADGAPIGAVVIAVRTLDSKLECSLMECLGRLGFDASQVRIISHAEAFLYHTLNQAKEVWNGTVGMFDLSDEGLRYYEMRTQRGVKKSYAIAEYEEMEESFDLDILDSSSGEKLGDQILCNCAERVMRKKNYASIFLSGKGFERQDWASGFVKLLSVSRRIFLETSIFSKGARIAATELQQNTQLFPFIFVCEGHLKAAISLDVTHKGQETTVNVAAVGDLWYGRKVVIYVIPDRQDTIEFAVTPLDSRRKRKLTLPLEGFPARNDRTMKVRLEIAFLDDRTMEVLARDLGFGEIYPSSGARIRRQFMISA